MIFLSVRHLLSRKKQSLLILTSITIGTASFVAFSGLMLGFQEKLMDQLVNNEAHVRISAREKFITSEDLNNFPEAAHIFWTIPPSGRRDSEKIEFPLGWFARLKQIEEVEASAPQVTANVLFHRGSIAKAGRIIGVDPARQVRVTHVDEYVTEGSFNKIGNSGNRLVVGESLLKSLGSRLNETILVSAGNGPTRPFRVVGVLSTGNQNIDQSMAYGSLSDIQHLRGTPSEITDIAIRLRDPNIAPQIASQLTLLGPDKVMAWQEVSASILSVFKTQDIVRYSVTIAIIIVAGFGIFNILSILVAQKRRDIAILRSMGFLPNDIIRLFLNQGLILGLLGGLLGLAVGYLLCVGIGQIRVASGRMGSSTGTMIISYEISIYVKAFLMAFISSSVSSILPARQAGSLDPMDIIRSGVA